MPLGLVPARLRENKNEVCSVTESWTFQFLASYFYANLELDYFNVVIHAIM